MLVAAAVVGFLRTLPPLPGSYLLAEGPTTAGSAEQLAGEIVAGLREAPDPLSNAAWEQVASSLVTPRQGGQVSIGYSRTATRRLITVQVEGERVCVDVRAERISSQRGSCPDN